MIKSTVFNIILDNDRKAFNSAIIERNGYHTIIIDKNIKRFETYQNLFFRLIQGVYKIDFLRKKKTESDSEIFSTKIKNKNIFDNLKEYSNLNHPYVANDIFFDLTPIELESNIEFYEAFGNSTNFLVFDFYENTSILNDNYELNIDTYTYRESISNFLKKVVEEDYSIATLELESYNRIDFKNLSVSLLGVFSSLKTNIKQLLGECVLEDRVALSIENKCLQTKFFIPKSEELNVQSTVTKDNLAEIHLSNIDINETDKLSTSLVVDNIFNNKEIDTLKFTFQNNISSNEIIEISLQNSDFNLKDLKKEIKDFRDRSNTEETEGNFLINELKGIYDERRTEFILIKQDTEEKYKLVFNNKHITDEEKVIKAKLILSVGQDALKAKLHYKKKSTVLLVESLEFLD